MLQSELLLYLCVPAVWLPVLAVLEARLLRLGASVGNSTPFLCPHRGILVGVSVLPVYVCLFTTGVIITEHTYAPCTYIAILTGTRSLVVF